MNIKNLILFIFFALFYIGCATQNKQLSINDISKQKIYNTYKKIENKPTELQDLYVNYYLDNEIEQVLNLMHLGLYAFQKEYYNDAEEAFDKVLLNIESIYGEDKYSEDAKSLWHGEDSKRFVGEPYERALAYYYRGLLFLQKHDYENARASFKGGWLQDARSQDKKFQSDFNIFLILDALSSKLNGDNNLYLSMIEEMKRYDKFVEDINIIDSDTTLSNKSNQEDRSEKNENIEENSIIKHGLTKMQTLTLFSGNVSYHDDEKVKLKDGSIIYLNPSNKVTGWEDHGLLRINKSSNEITSKCSSIIKSIHKGQKKEEFISECKNQIKYIEKNRIIFVENSQIMFKDDNVNVWYFTDNIDDIDIISKNKPKDNVS